MCPLINTPDDQRETGYDLPHTPQYGYQSPRQ